MSPTAKTERKAKPVKKRRTRIEIRQMTSEDLYEVWHLGEKLFTLSHLPFTYRAWNVDELLSLFNNDPELGLVAENAKKARF